MSEADDQINAAEEGIKNFKIDEETKNDNKTESDHVLDKDIEYQATTQSTTDKLNTGDNRSVETEKINSQTKNDSSDEQKSNKAKLEDTSKRQLQKDIVSKNEQTLSHKEKTKVDHTSSKLPDTHFSYEKRSSQSPDGIKIGIATWNVQTLGRGKNDNNEKLTKRIYVLQELIKEHTIGIISVQELFNKPAEDNLRHITEELNKRLGTTNWDYIFSKVAGPLGRGKEVSAFLWNKALVNFQDARLCSDKLHNKKTDADWDTYGRTPYWGQFTIPIHEINIICVHIYFGDKVSRRRQEVNCLPTTAEEISSNGKNIIILGDFNLKGPDDKGFKEMRDQNYKNALEGSQKTNVAQSTEKCYDNIWLKSTNDSLKFGESGVFREGFDDDPPSDHFPVWAEILITKKRNREVMSRKQNETKFK